jgi:hypothetical protein
MVLTHLNKSGKREVKFSELKSYMKNFADPQFNYEVFKTLHDGDKRIQNLIKNFDNQKIEFSTSSVDKINRKETPGRKSKESEVSKMAKRATKI